MDWLDSATAHMEEKSRFTYREPERKSEPEKPTHPITILGCIKTETGWYRCGFDENTKTIGCPFNNSACHASKWLDVLKKVRDGE